MPGRLALLVTMFGRSTLLVTMLHGWAGVTCLPFQPFCIVQLSVVTDVAACSGVSVYPRSSYKRVENVTGCKVIRFQTTVQGNSGGQTNPKTTSS